MDYKVTVEVAKPVILAAVRVNVPKGGIANAWKPALDKVWAFLRENQVANTGLNAFLYHHPERAGEPMNIDFGVQVLNRFEESSDVTCVTTTTGEVAQTVHHGPYQRLGEAHVAVHHWCAANQRPLGAASWEIYGHWNNDPAKLQTTIRYLLA